ncbi:MAG: hypothetical protein U0990_11890, partial [Candidatus Nanopelagicales bacterium]|nr:hypothetical protein [Candidatus Nanopelagicales bacterium]
NAQDAAFAVRARSYTADLDRLDAEHAAALQQAAEERASAVARESGRADANERDAEAFRKLKLGYKWLRETNLTVKGERVTVWSPDDPECGPNSAFPMRLYGHEYLLKDKAPEPEGTP